MSSAAQAAGAGTWIAKLAPSWEMIPSARRTEALMFQSTTLGAVSEMNRCATSMPKVPAAAAVLELATRLVRFARLRAGLELPAMYQPAVNGTLLALGPPEVEKVSMPPTFQSGSPAVDALPVQTPCPFRPPPTA